MGHLIIPHPGDAGKQNGRGWSDDGKEMARGWDSKAVESQIESAESRDGAPVEEHLGPEELERIRKREGLELSRARVVHDMESARNPRYRKMLQRALAFLEHELAELK